MSAYLYARVSTRDQRLDRQIEEARKFITDFNDCVVFCDKQSGKDFDRPAYQELISKLKRGDIVYVESLDRFGRDYDEMQNQWRIITKQIGADIVVMDMPLLDTRDGRDLTGQFIADLVLQVLSYVAEMERKANQKRREEGMACAKARGVKFGRPAKTVTNFEKFVEKQKRGLISIKAACDEMGICRSQWYNLLKQFAENNKEVEM